MGEPAGQTAASIWAAVCFPAVRSAEQSDSRMHCEAHSILARRSPDARRLALWPPSRLPRRAGASTHLPPARRRSGSSRPGLGEILVDSSGHTLYLFTRDRHDEDSCANVSGCLETWPALTTTHKPVAGAHVRASLLGTIKLHGRVRQVTYAGHPLYTYALDFDPADRHSISAQTSTVANGSPSTRPAKRSISSVGASEPPVQYASPIGGCTRVGGKHGMLGTSLRPCPYG